MSAHYLKSITNTIVLDDTYGTIIFQFHDFSWQREELYTFTDAFFQQMKSIDLIEIIEGADRMSARFTYQKLEFILNFECTCESIWIESYTGTHIASLKTLHQEIKAHLQ